MSDNNIDSKKSSTRVTIHHYKDARGNTIVPLHEQGSHFFAGATFLDESGKQFALVKSDKSAPAENGIPTMFDGEPIWESVERGWEAELNSVLTVLGTDGEAVDSDAVNAVLSKRGLVKSMGAYQDLFTKCPNMSVSDGVANYIAANLGEVIVGDNLMETILFSLAGDINFSTDDVFEFSKALAVLGRHGENPSALLTRLHAGLDPSCQWASIHMGRSALDTGKHGDAAKKAGVQYEPLWGMTKEEKKNYLLALDTKTMFGIGHGFMRPDSKLTIRRDRNELVDLRMMDTRVPVLGRILHARDPLMYLGLVDILDAARAKIAVWNEERSQSGGRYIADEPNVDFVAHAVWRSFDIDVGRSLDIFAISRLIQFLEEANRGVFIRLGEVYTGDIYTGSYPPYLESIDS